MAAFRAGDVVLVDLNPTRGHEQSGRRPVVVVSHPRYAAIPGLFLAVPLTSVDRRLPHHVPIEATSRSGLERRSYAMTEQIRALSRSRVDRVLGAVDAAVRAEISRYLRLFIA